MKIEADVTTGNLIDSLLLNYEYEEIQQFILQLDFMIGDSMFTEVLIERLQETLDDDFDDSQEIL